ncbi:MAG: NAD(P)-binding domain-containing protein [Rubrivivax sp.]|nr:NAD(P)-binding domain-containing protein [Rubrivivax sp.]
MQVGMNGLGGMGAEDGAAGAASQTQLVFQLGRPRTVWLMLPAVAVDQALGHLLPLPLPDPSNIVVDGGDSHDHDDMRPGMQLRARGVHGLDGGTRGGVAGLENGYALMIGGPGAVVEQSSRSLLLTP